MPRLVMRAAVVLGPMPQSMRMEPHGERRTEAFPEEPLARMERESDIRVWLMAFGKANWGIVTDEWGNFQFEDGLALD
jgi:hypothetical protein